MDDDDLPRRRSDELTALVAQHLDKLSVAELRARVAVLEAEIARTQAQLHAATGIKADADALFRKGG